MFGAGELSDQEDELVVLDDHLVNGEAEALIRRHPVGEGLAKARDSLVFLHGGLAVHHRDEVGLGPFRQNALHQPDALLSLEHGPAPEQVTPPNQLHKVIEAVRLPGHRRLTPGAETNAPSLSLAEPGEGLKPRLQRSQWP